MRGDYAWLGFGFMSCHNDTNYTLPAVLHGDYGTPTGPCTSEGSGVFRREYTKASVSMDCGRWLGRVETKTN